MTRRGRGSATHVRRTIVQVTLEKQARQLDVMKAGVPAAGPGAAKGKGRKAERLEKSMKLGVFRELTAIRWKQALVVRFLGRVQGACPVCPKQDLVARLCL